MIDLAEVMMWCVFVLLNLATAGWIFYNLFDPSLPLLSLVVSMPIAAFALVCVSPLTAAIACVAGFFIAGMLTLFRPKT
ncbi:hypothetical protein [Neisseria animalis]|nr:hypothetical protein [Neisseria animalis]